MNMYEYFKSQLEAGKSDKEILDELNESMSKARNDVAETNKIQKGKRKLMKEFTDIAAKYMKDYHDIDIPFDEDEIDELIEALDSLGERWSTVKNFVDSVSESLDTVEAALEKADQESKCKGGKCGKCADDDDTDGAISAFLHFFGLDK